MEFKKYIHAVGTGIKGNRDLSFDESKDMMTQILNQDIYPEQISAFLLGWRLKPETIEEFRGAISTCDTYIKKMKIENSIELGYPFDGKANNPYIFPLVGKVLKNSGLNLVVMGDKRQPAKEGLTVQDICTKVDLSTNTHYFDRADFFKKMHDLTDIRMRLGLRTGLNTIEKLPHVAQSEYAITGVFHKPFLERYVNIFSPRYKRFALIQGNEGTPELFSKGRLWVTSGINNEIQEHIVDPEYFGIHYTKSSQSITLEESLDQLNNPSDEYMKLAILNAAVFLFISQKTNSIEEGYEMLRI